MSHNMDESKKDPKTPIYDYKKRFLEYIEIEKGRAVLTKDRYNHYLQRFLTFSKITKPEQITSELVRNYRLWLNRMVIGESKAQGILTLKKKTQNYHLIALRAFLKYLARQDVKTLSPEHIELAKVGERQLDLITPDELRRLLDAPKDGDLKSLRDKAILQLFFSTGLRVSELCSLSRDLNLSADEFSIRGKGEKVRVVFLSSEAKKAVKNYLAKRVDLDDALFVRLNREDAKGGDLGMDKRSIERIVKQWAIRAGISKKVTPHVIRHCFATDLLSNGADLRSVQMLLGHANIGTTQIYTHVTDSELRRVHQQFHNRKK